MFDLAARVLDRVCFAIQLMKDLNVLMWDVDSTWIFGLFFNGPFGCDVGDAFIGLRTAADRTDGKAAADSYAQKAQQEEHATHIDTRAALLITAKVRADGTLCKKFRR
jgi:hypothetical protein